MNCRMTSVKYFFLNLFNEIAEVHGRQEVDVGKWFRESKKRKQLFKVQSSKARNDCFCVNFAPKEKNPPKDFFFYNFINILKLYTTDCFCL